MIQDKITLLNGGSQQRMMEKKKVVDFYRELKKMQGDYIADGSPAKGDEFWQMVIQKGAYSAEVKQVDRETVFKCAKAM